MPRHPRSANRRRTAVAATTLAAATMLTGESLGQSPIPVPSGEATPAPKVEAPKAKPPKAQAPKAEAPKAQPPKAQAPKAEAPKAQPPKPQPPKPQPPKPQPPKPQPPKPQPPKPQPPKAQAPEAEAPKAQPPKAQAPKAEAPKAKPPKAQAPKAEAPRAQPPKAEAPKPEPPKTQAPNVEAPKVAPRRAPAPPQGGDSGPSAPRTPSVPDQPAGAREPSAPDRGDEPVERAAPRVDAPRAGVPEAGTERVQPQDGGRLGVDADGGITAGGGNPDQTAGPAGDGAATGAATGAGVAAAAGGALLEVLGASRSSRAASVERLSTRLERSDSFRRTASQRRLRRVLERHGDCLTTLPAVARRIVLMRVGADGRRPLSRRQVARRLDIPVSRVVESERGAIRKLRTGAASCSSGTSSGEISTVVLPGAVPGVDAGSAARGLGALMAGGPDAARAATSAGRSEVAGARMSGSSAAELESMAGSRVDTPFGTFDPTSGLSVALASLFAVLAAITALLLAREVRRQWRAW